MSLLVPAWWHWSGCRGSSCRSRSQGSLGSSRQLAPLWAAPELRAGSPLRAEHRYTWPGPHHCTSPHQQQQPALCITPGNTGFSLIKGHAFMCVHSCLCPDPTKLNKNWCIELFFIRFTDICLSLFRPLKWSWDFILHSNSWIYQKELKQHNDLKWILET